MKSVTNKLSNGIDSLMALSLTELKELVHQELAKHEKRGLYLRLQEHGYRLREAAFIEVKNGRAGYEYTLKTLLALRALPNTNTRLNKLKLAQS